MMVRSGHDIGAATDLIVHTRHKSIREMNA
jgi:hypothetical protein